LSALGLIEAKILGFLKALAVIRAGNGAGDLNRIELIDLILCLNWGLRGDQRSLDSFLGLFIAGY
jgi:hypothetical protein